jgi:hypothetical protein
LKIGCTTKIKGFGRKTNISKGVMYEIPNIMYELLMMRQIGTGIFQDAKLAP